MPRYVAFLRAVNVGKRRVEMARLKEALEALGHRDVSTYINSGNAIFSTSKARSGLTAPIERKLEEVFGFEVPTLLRTDGEVKALAERKPFGEVGPERDHMVVFLRQALTKDAQSAVEALSGERDTLVVEGTEVHWLIDGKMVDSQLRPKHWKALGDQPSTVRNHTMLRKLTAKL